jgi:hypothetical protein
MSILRLSTLSLTVAIAVFVLGYVNPSAAKPEPCVPGDPEPPPRCKPKPSDDPNELLYTVDLKGPFFPAPPDMRGAFEFENAASANLESKGRMLEGNQSVQLERALDDTDPQIDCSTGDADVMSACIVWNDVFSLCGLLGPYPGGGVNDHTAGPTEISMFTVESGDWSVSKGGGKIWLSLEFALDSPLEPDDPLFTNRLSASLQLTRPCDDPVDDPSCVTDENDKLIPTEAGETIYTLVNEASIHLRGQGGVTHSADCHADEDSLSTSYSTLVITAK